MHVVVLGGGYAGLLVARELGERLPEDVALTLVDETGDHLVQHELHKTIRNPEFADAITLPLADLVDCEVRTARVESIDRGARRVELDDGALTYDVCAVCLGSETDFHGIDGVEEHATPLKRLDHAAEVREGFERVVAAGGGRVVVGGAGLAGVQVAGELAEFARETGVAADTEVLLVEQLESVAPNFPANFRRAVREELVERDVTIRTGTQVEDCDAEAVTLSGERVAYDQLVWTGGVRGPDALGGERPTVRAHLRLDDRTFAVGDAARVIDADGEAVPASAQAAVRAAPVAARNVARVVDSLRTDDDTDVSLEQWRFDSPGWLVSVGDDAVAQLGPQVVRGTFANLVKSGVGVTYLADHGSLRAALDVVRGDLGKSLGGP